ncbi:MAG: O-antigen ligase family protein [Thermoflexales bacterium]|nr:O-antigen ligase family protein [Thermoflexales bacterium]
MALRSLWVQFGKFYRPLIIAGVILADLMLGYVALRLRPDYLLAAVAAVPLLLIALRRPESGILGLLLTAAFVRVTLPTGTQSRIVASLVLAALLVGLWLARNLVEKRPLLKPSPVNRPLIAILVVSVVSYIWCLIFRDPLVIPSRNWPIVQIAALVVMMLLPGVLLLTADTVSDPRWMRVIYWATVGIGATLLFTKIVNVGNRFINTGGLFSLWFVSLIYGQILFNRELSGLHRLALVGLLALWLYDRFILNTRWLAGWVPPFLAIGLLTFLKSRKWFLVMLVIIAALLALEWRGFIQQVISGESAESGVTRLAAWVVNWRVTGRHILFGTGPAGYAIYYMSYFPHEAMATHSNYIDILSQLGIVGLGVYLWLLGTLVALGLRAWRQERGKRSFTTGLAAGTLGGCAGVILAMATGDWLVPFVYTQTIAGFDHAVYSWLWLGIMVSLAGQGGRE